MKELKGDILTVKEGYICHQVNVNGVMGAGLACQIKYKWPHVYNKYRSVCFQYEKEKSKLLGKILTVPVDNKLSIVNLFGQYLYRDTRQTRYDAVADGFELISKSLKIKKNLYVPKFMGCGLGGGQWDIYLAIITHYIPDVNVVEYKNENVNYH